MATMPSRIAGDDIDIGVSTTGGVRIAQSFPCDEEDDVIVIHPDQIEEFVTLVRQAAVDARAFRPEESSEDSGD